MVNEVLGLLEDESFFSTIGPERTYQFIQRVVRLADRGDCLSYEILDGIGERLGICVMCCQRRDDLEDGACSSCR